MILQSLTHNQFVALVIVIAGTSMFLTAFAVKWFLKQVDKELDKTFNDEDNDYPTI